MSSPVFAGIVTYNPDIDRLHQNVQAVLDQVDGIIIVDNGSPNIIAIQHLFNNIDKIQIVPNKNNAGIAKALNQIMSCACDNGAEWVLTLDQDSVISDGLVDKYLNYTNVPDVGMMTCFIQDRNAGEFITKETQQDYIEVERCITSGCFTKVCAWEDAGGFDEKMFIDFVDYDMCLSIREKGYIIIQLNFVGLLHELGHSKDVRFLGRKWVVSNHSSFRKYYIVRNRMYYIKKHSKILNTWAERRHLLGFITLTLFREPNKVSNARAMMKGFIDYWKM